MALRVFQIAVLHRPHARRLLLFIALVTPAVILRLATAAHPIFQSLLLSFTNNNLLLGTDEYIGAKNYAAIAHDSVATGAIWFTIFFVAVSTVLEVIFGLLVAVLLNAEFRFRSVARVINLIPWAIPGIVVAYMFQWMLDDQYGPISQLHQSVFGGHYTPLISSWSARLWLIVVNVWKNAPFMAIVFLAGLQGIPQSVYEAAAVDGATSLRRFVFITVPMVLPLTITMGLFFLVGQLASFDLIYGLTNGGPGTATSVLALQVFQNGILFFKFGYSSALSTVLLLLVAVAAFLGVTWRNRSDVVL